MARVTVEDCVLKIPNRFELVMKAAQRARDISAGASLTMDRDDDKNPVVALREIADETVDLGELEEALILGHQKHVEADEPEEELADFQTASQAGEQVGADEKAPEPAEVGAETADLGAVMGGAVEIDGGPAVLYEDVDLKD